MTYVVRWGILYVAILTSSSSNLINFNRIFITHWKWSPNWFDKLKTILYKNKISSHKQICTIPNVNLVVVYIHCKSKRNHFLDSYHILLKNTVFFFFGSQCDQNMDLKKLQRVQDMTLPLSKLLLWFSALSFRVGVFFNAKTRVVLMFFFTIKNNNCKLKRWCVRLIKNKISRREALCVLKYLNLCWRNCSIIFC
jgi:hypothetical protein